MKEILEKYYHIDSIEAEAMFNSMDTDHDDVIAYSEFLAAAMQGRIKVHEDVLRRTFRKFDVDNCRPERTYSAYRDSCFDVEKSILDGRYRLDLMLFPLFFMGNRWNFGGNLGGKITAEDLRGILGEHFEGTDAQDLIREADTNGDGMIEYDEFLAYFHSHDRPAEELFSKAFGRL